MIKEGEVKLGQASRYLLPRFHSRFMSTADRESEKFWTSRVDAQKREHSADHTLPLSNSFILLIMVYKALLNILYNKRYKNVLLSLSLPLKGAVSPNFVLLKNPINVSVLIGNQLVVA